MYYDYVPFYVDDVVFISNDPICTTKGIQDTFKLKGDNIEEPDMYPGAYLLKITNVDGRECWDMSSEKYYKAVVTNVESVLAKRGLQLPLKCVDPLRCGYL